MTEREDRFQQAIEKYGEQGSGTLIPVAEGAFDAQRHDRYPLALDYRYAQRVQVSVLFLVTHVEAVDMGHIARNGARDVGAIKLAGNIFV